MYEAAINTCSNSELPLFCRLAIVDQCGWGSAAADVVIRIDCNRILGKWGGGEWLEDVVVPRRSCSFSPHHSNPLLVLYANDRNVTSCCRRHNRQGDKWTRSGTQQGEHDHEHKHGQRHGHGHLMVAEHVGDSWQQLSNMCGQVVNQEY